MSVNRLFNWLSLRVVGSTFLWELRSLLVLTRSITKFIPTSHRNLGTDIQLKLYQVGVGSLF